MQLIDKLLTLNKISKSDSLNKNAELENHYLYVGSYSGLVRTTRFPQVIYSFYNKIVQPITEAEEINIDHAQFKQNEHEIPSRY